MSSLSILGHYSTFLLTFLLTFFNNLHIRKRGTCTLNSFRGFFWSKVQNKKVKLLNMYVVSFLATCHLSQLLAAFQISAGGLDCD